MQMPEKFWKRLVIGVSVLVTAVAIPWAGFQLFAEALRDTQIILTNDTKIPLQVTAIKQSHDNNEIYMAMPVAAELGKSLTLDGSVDNIRCIFVTGVGGVHFDSAYLDQSPLSSIVTVTNSKNLFGRDVKNYHVSLSELLATFETNECPYMDYIGEIPPAKIPQK